VALGWVGLRGGEIPKKSDYRKFIIRTVKRRGRLRRQWPKVVGRRYAALQEESLALGPASF